LTKFGHDAKSRAKLSSRGGLRMGCAEHTRQEDSAY
jgi:hypothetical protein